MASIIYDFRLCFFACTRHILRLKCIPISSVSNSRCTVPSVQQEEEHIVLVSSKTLLFCCKYICFNILPINHDFYLSCGSCTYYLLLQSHTHIYLKPWIQHSKLTFFIVIFKCPANKYVSPLYSLQCNPSHQRRGIELLEGTLKGLKGECGGSGEHNFLPYTWK